ncbi:MAG: ferritin-like domain-containing protein [Pseudomonadota bacterium]
MSTHATKVEALVLGRSVPSHRVRTDASKSSTRGILRQVTAGYIDTAMAARQARWNVRGQDPATWHGIFEACHIDLDAHADALAERVVDIGSLPPGTVQVVTTTTSLVPFPAEMREQVDLAEALTVRLGQLATLTRRAIAQFEISGDPVTINHLAKASATVEKYLWVIESQSRPN